MTTSHLPRCSLLVRISLTLALALVGCSKETPGGAAEQVEFREPPAEGEPSSEHRLRTVYVPAYSHMPRSTEPSREYLLSILLSVRNVDPTAAVVLTHVDYFDTDGHRVRRYLDEPRELRPLETAEFTVERSDDAGGSGANFLIYWEGPADAHPLLTESIMWGLVGGGYTAFTSRGIELERRPIGRALGDGASLPAPDLPPAGTAPDEQ